MPLSPSDRALGDLLVARSIITLPQLDEATQLVETWNVRLTDAVLSRAWMHPEDLYQGLAFHFDLPFVDLVNEPPDRALLRPQDADFYARELIIPWRRRDGRLAVATANPGPETVLTARRRWGAAVEFVVTSKFGLVWTVQEAFDRDPVMSARTVGACLKRKFISRAALPKVNPGGGMPTKAIMR